MYQFLKQRNPALINDKPHNHHYFPLDPVSVQQILVCPYCKYQSKYFSRLINHIFSSPCFQQILEMTPGPDFVKLLRDNPGFDESTMTCGRCGIGFSNNILYMAHMDHHNSKGKFLLFFLSFFCHTCFGHKKFNSMKAEKIVFSSRGLYPPSHFFLLLVMGWRVDKIKLWQTKLESFVFIQKQSYLFCFFYHFT